LVKHLIACIRKGLQGGERSSLLPGMKATKEKKFCAIDRRTTVSFKCQNIFFIKMFLKVHLHWRDFARDFALACTFSKENK
jgi:hypothetical protein